MLTFATPRDREQAEQLMQPCLIRVIDNIRKHTETLDWQSDYVEQIIWPGDATEAERQRVKDLAAQLETADPEQATAIRQQLDQLPAPAPAYELRLSRGDQTASLDIWDLCFQVCFVDYRPQVPATVDAALWDGAGEIDWITLDGKAKALVETAIDQITAP
jgi:hypothetical protein